jgi:hypothetical protein
VTKKGIGIDVLETHPRWLERHRAFAALCLLLCGAWTYKLTFEVVHWREQSQLARTVASDPRMPIDQRRDGIVGSARDARLTIEVLQQLQQTEDQGVAQQATLALDAIRKALR